MHAFLYGAITALVVAVGVWLGVKWLDARGSGDLRDHHDAVMAKLDDVRRGVADNGMKLDLLLNVATNRPKDFR